MLYTTIMPVNIGVTNTPRSLKVRLIDGTVLKRNIKCCSGTRSGGMDLVNRETEKRSICRDQKCQCKVKKKKEKN